MSAFAVDPSVPRASAADIAAALDDPGFGRYFVDHMAIATWTGGEGWHDQKLIATGPLSLHPALAGLHYAQEIFEGLKAYRHPDDSVWMFRPEMNAARFAHSATRMAMPPLPEADFIDSVTQLVALNLDWVPQADGEKSLYLRPFMFASESLIGVRISDAFSYLCLGMPVMPFYPDPLTLWVSPTFSRSMAGGTGDTKCGGNYGASMIAEDEAHRNGCGQVLWLDSATRSWVEEGGTMNFLVVTADGELVTPDLNGTILAGVTRDSLLKLATSHGLRPVERPLAFAELCEGIASGRITEALACGTAAVVSPVVGIKSPEIDLTVGDGTPGAKTLRLRNHLTGIQFGTEPDVHGWMRRVG
ncbi:branched-chain amino acid aminotransferase [Brooklawnia sp.]|uniref:branched-chain amino acid aminotransferase n=1 Tax=Brooklawnia sp. TaxID=2699740 RepID=UPI00311D8A90